MQIFRFSRILLNVSSNQRAIYFGIHIWAPIFKNFQDILKYIINIIIDIMNSDIVPNFSLFFLIPLLLKKKEF